VTAPLMAALAAAANFPLPEPVPAVNYRSQGRVLVIGPKAIVLGRAGELAENMPVTALVTDGDASGEHPFPLNAGTLLTIGGWLGSFEVHWAPADGKEHAGKFDLVLDLQDQPYFTMHQPPQGYYFPGSAPAAQEEALLEIADAVGEFEKPKFFLYHERTCAHSRAKLQGCNRCIDVCSTQAIEAAGDHIRVEPHLCMGCGACATVCPSGAMRYNYPSMSYWGGKLKALLAAYAAADGEHACLLLHGEGDVAPQSGSLPPRVIPLPVFHVASIGLDWLLGALALGANQVVVLISGNEAPQYLQALRAQMVLGEQILHGLGYSGEHFRLMDAAELPQLQALQPAQVPASAAAFGWFDEKRTTLEFCIDHFTRHAPVSAETMALPDGAPFGTVEVAGEKCTLCYSCVAVCPAGALMDGAGQPQLNFIERNCVQCGLCENACPEDAIRLKPRLLLTPQAKQRRTLHADQPFHCVRCGKVFGTRSMVAGMTTRLTGHSMFNSPEALERLKMCGDCRVADMMAAPMREAQP
jgi:ferredoxin